MAKVSSDIGFLGAALEPTYGTQTDPAANGGICVLGAVEITVEDEFAEIDKLSTTREQTPGKRRAQNNTISFSSAITHMEDIIGGTPNSILALLAAGLRIESQGLAAGTGNHIELRPQDTNFPGVSFRAYHIADDSVADSNVSPWDCVGTRGELTITLDPGNDAGQYDFEGTSLRAIPGEFAANAIPTVRDLELYEMRCATATINAAPVDIKSISFTLGNEVEAETPDLRTCQDGIDEAILKNGTISFEMTLQYTDAQMAAAGYLRTAWEGDVDWAFVLQIDQNGQRYQITCPRMRPQPVAIEAGDNDKYIVNVSGVLQSSTTGANDALQIRYEVL